MLSTTAAAYSEANTGTLGHLRQPGEDQVRGDVLASALGRHEAKEGQRGHVPVLGDLKGVFDGLFEVGPQHGVGGDLQHHQKRDDHGRDLDSKIPGPRPG
jgi:hypothetical protein